MKKYFEYIGLLVITCFSFYYTEKVTKIMNSKDPIMVSIEAYKEESYVPCKEGYKTSDGVVLGVNGKVVNTTQSYSNMQGYGYKEDLMVFEEVQCNVTKDNTKDSYIIKANEATNSVSLFINVIDGSYLKDIVEISKYKGVRINFIVTGSVMETHKDYLKEIYNDGFDIVYGGVEENDFKKYLSVSKQFQASERRFCVNLGIKDNLDMCKKSNINSLKPVYNYTYDMFLNTKKTLNKGNFYIYKESENVVEEISPIINYISGKQIRIVSISELLN